MHFLSNSWWILVIIYCVCSAFPSHLCIVPWDNLPFPIIYSLTLMNSAHLPPSSWVAAVLCHSPPSQELGLWYSQLRYQQVLMKDLSCASTNGYYDFLEQCWASRLDCSEFRVFSLSSKGCSDLPSVLLTDF